jgi:ArsR family transcriptional regulator
MTLSRPVSEAVAERIGHRLDVLAHPARIRIVDVLELQGELSVSELAEAVGVSVYDASQHLAMLRSAGVVRNRRMGRLRCYRLADPTVVAIYTQVAGRLQEQIGDARRELGGEAEREGEGTRAAVLAKLGGRNLKG